MLAENRRKWHLMLTDKLNRAMEGKKIPTPTSSHRPKIIIFFVCKCMKGVLLKTRLPAGHSNRQPVTPHVTFSTLHLTSAEWSHRALTVSLFLITLCLDTNRCSRPSSLVRTTTANAYSLQAGLHSPTPASYRAP